MFIVKCKVDPLQSVLFDPERDHVSRVGYNRLQQGWQGIFRRSLLAVMPVEELGESFSSDTGRWTKELYSMAGLLVIAEMRNWTSTEAAEAYMFDLSVQYALNVGHQAVELSSRTVERYQRLLNQAAARQWRNLAAVVPIHGGHHTWETGGQSSPFATQPE